MPVKQSLRDKSLKKKVSNKKQVTSPSQKKIAASPSAPRNDDKRSARGRLSVPVFSLAGRASGNLSLPKEIFGVEVNEKLLAQALRVYMTNEKTLPGNTKTRGEVEGSTAKIYRQKGTGRARHGAIRAPIFVGGGVVFGPNPRKVRLELPKKMKKAALNSALSSKVIDKSVMGFSGIEKASGKTKEISKLLKKIGREKKLSSTLIVTADKTDNIIRAVRNIPQVNTLPVQLINAYEIVRHNLLLITKEAVDVLSGKRKAERVKL